MLCKFHLQAEKTLSAVLPEDDGISELLQYNENAAEILFRHGMHCLGCAIAHQETIEQATNAHGEDLEQLLNELNGLA